MSNQPYWPIEVSIHYLAGLFDAVGNISISDTTVVVSIGNPDPHIPCLLKQHFGGTVVGNKPYATAHQKRYICLAFD